MAEVSMEFMKKRHPYIYAYNLWMDGELDVEEAIAYIVRDPDFMTYCHVRALEPWTIAYDIVTVSWTGEYMDAMMETEDAEEGDEEEPDGECLAPEDVPEEGD